MVFTTNSRVASTEKVFQITPPRINLDPYARRALADVESSYDKPTEAERAITTLRQSSLSNITKLTDRFNSSGLDDIYRLLLSSPILYTELIQIATKTHGAKLSDIESSYNAVLRLVADKPRSLLLGRMLAHVLADKSIATNDGSTRWARLSANILANGLPLANGQVQLAVNNLLARAYNEGEIPHYVDAFAKRPDTGISAFVMTPAVQQGMIDYLVKLGVQIKDPAAFKQGAYDEYFALAYSEALKTNSVTTDPIDAARIKGGETTWNFKVDNFESTESQGVIPGNIRAAGALDYIYCIGERMHVFDVANALVLRWASGVLDVPAGPTASKLYRYHKLRSERSTPQERAMLYRRILSRGGGRMLSGMVPNEDFPRFWHQLMTEVAEYIRKSEGNRYKDSWVSRTPLYEATKHLQYNLSENMTGMSHLQVTEDYAHLQEALDILKSRDVLDTYGGRRKSIWTVIEQIAREDLGLMVPTAPIRTSAVEGNKVFQWVANFSEGMVKDADFKAFLGAAEAWIIAQASMEEDDDSFGSEEEEMDEMLEGDDGFDDWDD